jgi:hypothetical protein
VSSVKYELHFYIPENGFLHSRRRKNLKSDKAATMFAGRILPESLMTLNPPTKFAFCISFLQ